MDLGRLGISRPFSARQITSAAGPPLASSLGSDHASARPERPNDPRWGQSRLALFAADRGAKSEFGPKRDLTWRVDRGKPARLFWGSLASILSYPLHVRLPLISDVGRVKWPVSLVGEDARDGIADQRLHLRDHGCKRVAVIWISGHRLMFKLTPSNFYLRSVGTRRRDVLAAIGGAAFWPKHVTVQTAKPRRIGLMANLPLLPVQRFRQRLSSSDKWKARTSSSNIGLEREEMIWAFCCEGLS
jgi:hypothetical protein